MARSPGGSGRGSRDRGRDRDEENELKDKLVTINRVAKVVKGGRRFAFAAIVVVGDQRGRVGHGAGKAREVPEAIRKATEAAKRGLIRVPLRDGRTLHHDVKGRFGAGKVTLRAAPAGTGIIAGGPMRAVFETLGIKDIVAKSVGTSNPHNMIKATFVALQQLNSPRMVATRRGKKLREQAMAEGKKIKITQTGSHIGRTEDQRGTLIGLGLNKRHRTRELVDTPEVRGMINKVRHLVRIDEETR